MQEKLKFKSNFIVSNKKRIIAMASFVQEGQTYPYKIHMHTIPIICAQPDWKLELIIIESPSENILESFQVRLAGKYFCYRHYDDDKINFVCLDPDQ